MAHIVGDRVVNPPDFPQGAGEGVRRILSYFNISSD